MFRFSPGCILPTQPCQAEMLHLQHYIFPWLSRDVTVDPMRRRHPTACTARARPAWTHHQTMPFHPCPYCRPFTLHCHPCSTSSGCALTTSCLIPPSCPWPFDSIRHKDWLGACLCIRHGPELDLSGGSEGVWEDLEFLCNHAATNSLSVPLLRACMYCWQPVRSMCFSLSA